ncbi:MAG: hypothetical protein B6I26_05915 [Desulfobacteraceae bacterium 4572_130]|nr:MAG: hypothetical protein B6I26_05915 [Desulfobacteraceae bacterium 4572_130]
MTITDLWSLKLNIKRQLKVAKIKVPYPINKNDEFDLKAQKEIAHKYMKIEEIKEIINKEIKEIEEIKIDYE